MLLLSFQRAHSPQHDDVQFMLNCRFFDEVFEAGEHFNKQPTSMPPKNSGKVAMRRSSRLETFKQNSHLDEHLLDSNEYSTWITEKSNSSTARRSIYLIALCVLTLLSASFIKLNLSNNDKAIVQQTQEILEALHQAQVSLKPRKILSKNSNDRLRLTIVG